jgi:tetratricopeptide (TPR) repeat protein
MRRQLNLKTCLVLLLTLACLGVGGHFLHGYQLQRSAEGLKAQALREEEADNLAKAQTYLATYLGFRPWDNEAREHFALLLLGFRPGDNDTREHLEEIILKSPLKGAALQQAFFALERVLRDAPERHDLHLKAAYVAQRIGRPSDAIAHLEVLTSLPQADAEVFELLGGARESNKQLKQAVEAYNEAIKRDPRLITSYMYLATLQQTRLKDPQAADKVIAEMLQANGGSDKALLAWARYQIAFGKGKALEEAHAALQKLIDKGATDDPDVLLLAADMELSGSNLEKARGLLRRGLEKHPKDFRYRQALARVTRAAGDNKEALRILKEGLDQLPDQLMVICTTADLFLEMGAKDEAQELMKKIARDEQTAGILDYLDSRIHTMNGEELPLALELLKRAGDGLTRFPDLQKQALLLAGECHRRLGHPDQHLAAVRAALLVDPTWPAARFSEAAALQNLGQIEAAADLYSSLAERGVPEARLNAVRLWLAWYSRLPKAKQRWDEVEVLLKGTPEALGTKAEYLLLRINLSIAEGKLAQARKEAEAACAALPKEPLLWLARADVETLDAHPERVLDLLTQAEQAAGDRAVLRLARLRHLAKNPKQQKEAQDLLARYEKAESQLSSTELAAWLDGLAVLKLAQGNPEGAEQALTRLAALQPGNLSVRAVLADALAARSNAERLKTLVEEMRHIEGDEGTWWRYAEAVRRMLGAQAGDRGARQRIRALLAECRKRRPNWRAPLVLEAQLDEMEGNKEGAISNYRLAVNLGERRQDVVRRLVDLYYGKRRYAEAQAVLTRVQPSVSPGDLGRLAAEVSLSAGEAPEQTLQLVRQAVRADSRDYRDHLWLGLILPSLQKSEEAEKELRRAVELGPSHPEPRVALVQHLAGKGKTEEAEKFLAQAAEKLPAEAAPLALAACCEAVGDRDRALEHYKKALALRPDDPAVQQTVGLFYLRKGDATQASVHLRKVLENSSTPAPLAAATRRSLALMLASSGSYQRCKDALDLLAENTRGQQAQPEDQRVIALIHACQPGGRAEAIRNLEASFAQMPPEEGERFLLARLYAGQRDWPHARQQFVQLLTANASPNPGYLAVFVQLLIQQDELEEAENWLEKLDPKDFRTAALKARLWHASKKDDDARALLRQWGMTSAKDPAVQLAVASLFDAFGYPAEAESYYRAAQVKDKPASQIPLITYLGRQNRLKEALDLCEQLKGKVPEETMVQVWFNCLRASSHKDEPQWQRVEGWVQAAMRKDPGQVLFALALANLRDLEGKDDEAEKIYREVLRQNPDNRLALNNLAVLLAFRGNAGNEALEHINHALELAGPQPGLLDSRAIVYMSLGQWQQAVRDLEDVGSMEPSLAHSLRLARAYLMGGDRRAALLTLRKAKTPNDNIKLTDFHPLERPVYEQVLRDLALDQPGNSQKNR